MSTTLISAGQSLLDVCLQELGTLDALFELADANGLSITDPLTPGQVLQVPATALSRAEVVSYFAGRLQRVNVPDRPGTAPVPPPPAARGDFLKTDFTKNDFN